MQKILSKVTPGQAKPAGWHGQGFQFGNSAKYTANQIRHSKLLDLAASANNLAQAANQGKEDSLLTSQAALILRRLAGLLEDSSEEVSREIDLFGQQVLAASKGLR